MVIWGILVLSLDSKLYLLFCCFYCSWHLFLTFSDVDHIIIFVDLSLLWGLIVHLLPVQGVVNFLLDGPAQGFVNILLWHACCFNREGTWHFTLCCGVVTDWPNRILNWLLLNVLFILLILLMLVSLLNVAKWWCYIHVNKIFQNLIAILYNSPCIIFEV
jgi:hypothetical protein